MKLSKSVPVTKYKTQLIFVVKKLPPCGAMCVDVKYL